MCDKFSKKSEQHVEEISNGELVAMQKNVQYKLSSIIYPKAHLYYGFAEDTHPSTRIVMSLQKERLPLPVTSSTKFFQDTHLETMCRYLSNDPSNFIIFGKPGLNSVDLASAIADTWKCVLISPSSLVQQEIDSGSKIGLHIKKTKESGKCVALDIINLIQDRIKMSDVQYRGYVVEGLPLIPDDVTLLYGREFHEDQTCDRTVSCNYWADIANASALF